MGLLINRLFFVALVIQIACSNEPEFNRTKLLKENSSDLELVTMKKSWQATTWGEATIKYQPDYDYVDQEFEVARIYNDQAVNYQQNKRSTRKEVFNQGTIGNRQSEAIRQQDLGIVDLLVVVDNSNSMKEEQDNLASKLRPLIAKIKTTDWRVGLTTTDPKSGCLVRWFDGSDPNVEAAFETEVSALGIRGSGNERGIAQSVAGLSCPEQAWTREGSNIGVLIVSDEDNCRDERPCRFDGPKREAAYLTDYLAGIRTLGVDARVYGIISEPNKPCETAGEEAPIYAQAIANTQGVTGSICDQDFGPILDQISTDLRQIIKAQFKLKYQPQPGSVQVMVNGQTMEQGFEIVNDRLVFSQPPPAGASIQINYLSGTSTMTDTWSIPNQGAVDEFSVAVNQQNLNPGQYQFDPVTRKLRILVMPPERANVQVTWKERNQLAKRFRLNRGFVLESLKIMVNGQLTNRFAWNQVTQFITFEVAPPEEANIRATMIVPGDIIREYPFEHPQNATYYTLFKSGEEETAVGFEVKDNGLMIQSDTVTEGDLLTIRYRKPESQTQTIDLGGLPRAGKFAVENLPIDCSADSFILEGATLTTSCDLNDNEELVVSYTKLLRQRTRFRFDPIQDPDSWDWVVMLNGIPSESHRREGVEIIFDKGLPLETEVSAKIRKTPYM